MRGWLQAGRARGRQGEAFQGLQPPLSAGSLGQEPGVGRVGQWEGRAVLPDSPGIISGGYGHPSPRHGQQRGTGSHGVTGVRHSTLGCSPKADPLARTAASTNAKLKRLPLKSQEGSQWLSLSASQLISILLIPQLRRLLRRLNRSLP